MNDSVAQGCYERAAPVKIIDANLVILMFEAIHCLQIYGHLGTIIELMLKSPLLDDLGQYHIGTCHDPSAS